MIVPNEFNHTPLTRAYWLTCAADDTLCMMCDALEVTLSGHLGPEETNLENIRRDFSDFEVALDDFRRVVFGLTRTAGLQPDHPGRDLDEN